MRLARGALSDRAAFIYIDDWVLFADSKELVKAKVDRFNQAMT
jgi:hypothetical protein